MPSQYDPGSPPDRACMWCGEAARSYVPGAGFLCDGCGKGDWGDLDALYDAMEDKRWGL